jgi:tripartite-type tricarboxylate transporter receptor subunit TctC
MASPAALPDAAHAIQGRRQEFDKRMSPQGTTPFRLFHRYRTSTRGVMRKLLAAAMMLAVGATAVHADEYPNRPIRLVSGFAAGGVTDGIARILAHALTAKFGQSVVVENKPGASGLISTTEVSRAAPDGYTLLVGGFGAQLIPPLVMAKYPLDVTKDLTPIFGVADFQNVVTINSKLPIKDMKELVAYAKANPGKLTFGSAGVGASNYLSAVWFMQKTGIDMVHVPSKGGFGPTTDLLSGNIDVVFENIPIMMGQNRSPAMRLLAVTGKSRSELFPDLPTVTEAGIPGYVVTSWISVFGPPGMPEPLVAKISKMISEALSSPDVQQRMQKIGFQPMNMGYKEFGKFFLEERAIWKEVVDKAGIKQKE